MADECRTQAEQTRNALDKEAWLKLATAWIKLAEDGEPRKLHQRPALFHPASIRIWIPMRVLTSTATERSPPPMFWFKNGSVALKNFPFSRREWISSSATAIFEKDQK
jgi:hypothetical protein